MESNSIRPKTFPLFELPMRCVEPLKATPRSAKNKVTSIIRFKMLYHFSDSTLIDVSIRFSTPTCNDRRLSNSRQKTGLPVLQVPFLKEKEIS